MSEKKVPTRGTVKIPQNLTFESDKRVKRLTQE